MLQTGVEPAISRHTVGRAEMLFEGVELLQDLGQLRSFVHRYMIDIGGAIDMLLVSWGRMCGSCCAPN